MARSAISFSAIFTACANATGSVSSPQSARANSSISIDGAGWRCVIAANPCRSALRLASDLPAAVRGPQALRLFCRFAAILRFDVMGGCIVCGNDRGHLRLVRRTCDLLALAFDNVLCVLAVEFAKAYPTEFGLSERFVFDSGLADDEPIELFLGIEHRQKRLVMVALQVATLENSVRVLDPVVEVFMEAHRVRDVCGRTRQFSRFDGFPVRRAQLTKPGTFGVVGSHLQSMALNRHGGMTVIAVDG